MNWQNQLINVYLTTCDFFSQLSPYVYLKISPNSSPSFTDEETITIYIFGILRNLRTVKSIYNFTKDFMPEWFPQLPTYEGFLFRLNNIHQVFPEFVNKLLKNKIFCENKTNEQDFLVVDSMPIMIAKNSRSYKCKIAKDITAQGYCSSKKTFYAGLKLHLFAKRIPNKLCSPQFVKITHAAMHDLSAVRNEISSIKNSIVFADKAYTSSTIRKKLASLGSEIHIPIKHSKFKDKLSDDEKVYSKSVSSMRQPIEIFFHWLIETSGIQVASKVRSTKGLIVHVFGRLSACLFKYIFIYQKGFLNS